ncbi:MAG: Crp/Fnr family transcriptional regulator [Betaproteobacteria bacterium]|nr:Crp/Fnr family transcriptional regulator [Betaproteobacteria bacterium]
MAVPALFLQTFPLLRALPEATLAALASQAGDLVFAKRAVVLQKGPPTPSLCLLAEGRLQAVDFTIDGREVGLYFINPGDYVGELSVIDGLEQPEFIIAVARSRVITLPRNAVRQAIFATPQTAESVTLRLSARLRAQSAQRTILSLTNPLQKICAQLQLLMVSTSAAQNRISNAPTHQEIAIMVNTSRETVTRVFQVLQAHGALQRQGNDLVLGDAQMIIQIAQGTRELPKP